MKISLDDFPIDGLRLTYRGQRTPVIPYDAPAILVKYRLQALAGIEEVQVVQLRGQQLCSSAGSVMEVILSYLLLYLWTQYCTWMNYR